MDHAKHNSNVPEKCRHHEEGDKCYKCGYGLAKVNPLKIALAIIIGVGFGIFLLNSIKIDTTLICSYVCALLLACILALVVDIRRIVLNCGYKK